MNHRKPSWIVLTLAGVLVLAISIVSTVVAYSREYQIGPMDVSKVGEVKPGVETALRGIRATSAAFAAGFAVLYLGTVLGPYRRGDVASWWTLLAGAVVVAGLCALRIPFLGTTLGAGTALPILVLTVIGLVLDSGRLKSAA